MAKKKKIYDVLPPRTKRVYQKEEEGIKIYKNEKRKQTNKKLKTQKIFWFPSSLVFGGLIILLIISLYLFFRLPKATIEIWPKLENLSFEQDITVSGSIDEINLEKNLIPAKYIELSKNFVEKFPATGNANEEGRASGKITLYNKYDPPTPLTLKAGTHFISDSGKLFKCSERITIPAAQKKEGKIIPGSVTINVVAVEGGESYNIPPSNFSIPGLKGTPYYFSIYGVSDQAMSGGYAGKIRKVIQDDINDAEKKMKEKVFKEIKEEIEKELGEGYILLDDAIIFDIEKSESKAKVGTIVENFDYEISAKAKALAFKKEVLEEFAKKYFVSQTPNDKIFLEDSIKINYNFKKLEEESLDKEISLTLNIEGKVYPKIDKNSLSLTCRGKNLEQIREIVKKKIGEDRFDKLEIKFWPFWVSKAPRNQKAIKINLKFEGTPER